MIKLLFQCLLGMMFVFAMYILLIIGSVWEDEVRCNNGYQPACEMLGRD
jgi:hypothetical protein